MISYSLHNTKLIVYLLGAIILDVVWINNSYFSNSFHTLVIPMRTNIVDIIKGEKKKRKLNDN